jgi:hypothetical protein
LLFFSFSVFRTPNKHWLIAGKDFWIRVLICGLINDAVSSSYCVSLQLRFAGWLVRIELERMRKEGIVAEFDVPPPRHVHRDEENPEKHSDNRCPGRYRNSGFPNMWAC